MICGLKALREGLRKGRKWYTQAEFLRLQPVDQGENVLEAAKKGLLKALELFLLKDPKCIAAKDAQGKGT